MLATSRLVGPTSELTNIVLLAVILDSVSPSVMVQVVDVVGYTLATTCPLPVGELAASDSIACFVSEDFVTEKRPFMKLAITLSTASTLVLRPSWERRRRIPGSRLSTSIYLRYQHIVQHRRLKRTAWTILFCSSWNADLSAKSVATSRVNAFVTFLA